MERQSLRPHRMETHSKQLEHLMNSHKHICKYTHSYCLRPLLTVTMAAKGAAAATVSSSDICPVCMFTSECLKLIIASPPGPSVPPHPTVQTPSDTDYWRMFALLTVMVLTQPPGLSEVMENLWFV